MITFTNTLTPDEFNTLRTSAGWRILDKSSAAKSIENTAFIVCVRDGEKAIGMARIISDYSYVNYISDVVVLPEYQGEGLGREIMSRIMTYINENTEQGQGKYIALMAAKGKEGFYEKFGLMKRPTDDFGCGMSMWLEKKGEV